MIAVYHAVVPGNSTRRLRPPRALRRERGSDAHAGTDGRAHRGADAAPTARRPCRRKPVTTTKKPTLNAVVVLPSTRRCVSRRRFRIRLRHPRGARVASAVVRVNGKKVATRRGRRITAPVNLRGLPKGRFAVKITVKLADGRTVSGTRRYRTCTPKKKQ